MDRKERIDDPLASMRSVLAGHQAGVWTALPGIIQAYVDNPPRVTVQPSIKAQVRGTDGAVASVALPLLTDCPVQFPAGGDCTLTFPVAEGDECLIVFASRCIDGWWQSGGVQEQAEMRMHDLSDGFALLGFRSVPRALSGVSTTSAQLRSDDGSTYFDLNPIAQTVKIVAPGGFEVVAPTQKFTASGSVEVDSPQSTFSGAVTVKGLFTFLAGLVGSATSGAAATITGAINFIGSLTSNGKRIDDGHTHAGVEPGPGSTGPVN
ncbi:hypothetical protein C7405_101640 [Paraburkholderia caballeronis]|uniref:Gp138 family membrane-puncturing spike protein n=1 Tax=Paraburkholderia caballeronis TaxID=416943 RepID=UPI0010652574|nr:Gp138 family membrane-puncturing spike protein [Paraburkholderia caballeronis]TDV39521.1 hypothetical protein C7405_101640 [Paraburkholderia caballeronis]